MQNNTLANDIRPYGTKNRWYKFTLKSHTTGWSVVDEESDIKNLSVSATGILTGVTFKEVNEINTNFIANETLATSSANISFARIRLAKTNGEKYYNLNINPGNPAEVDDIMIIYVKGLLVE